MKTNFKTFFTISIVAHLIIILIFVVTLKNETIGAIGEYVVTVDIVASGGLPRHSVPRNDDVRNAPADDVILREPKNPEYRHVKTLDPSQAQDDIRFNRSRSLVKPGMTAKPGTPGSGGHNTVLAKIKSKIERAKRYPKIAKKMKIEGAPDVSFQINNDGSLKFVSLTISSGEKILDNAALETIKRAAPLPYYEGPINLKISYRLNQ